MAEKPYLLITNDDGIHAPGIRHLWETVREHADTAIVAPQVERSGSGLSITWTKPLHIHPVLWEKNTPAWTLNGTPADCVKMALAVLLERKPDLIISGINRGSNPGRTVLYSGTIGGVIEGAFKNIPGIAFSFSDLGVAARHKAGIVLSHSRGEVGRLASYDAAEYDGDVAGGVTRELDVSRATALAAGIAMEAIVLDPGFGFAKHPEQNIALLDQGYIAAVPIHVSQMTDLDAFEKHKSLFETKLVFKS